MKPDFSDAYQKLYRADKHIREAKSRINSFLGTEFYRLHTVVNREKGRMEVRFESLHKPDKALNSIVGDAVGNMRSVLDYIFVAILSPVTGISNRGGFPFGDDAKNFNGMVAKESLKMPDFIRDFFVNEIQAYKGGKGEAFWTLNKLRNIDKHRLLLTTVNLAGLHGSWRYGGIVFTDCSINVLEGQNCGIIDGPIDTFELTDNLTPTFKVFFKEIELGDQIPLIDFLDGTRTAIERLLNALEVI